MKAKRHGRSKLDLEKGTIRCPAAQSSVTPAASQDNKESLQTFFNALDDLVFVFDPEGRILFANPAAQNLLGYTPAELAGMAAFDFHPPEQRQEAAKLLAGVIAGKITICPIPLQARDGTRILVETKILHGQWRGKDALFGMGRDITERKQAEEAVRQSEERYRALVETAPDVVYAISDKGVFASLNPAFEAITGWARTEWLGKSFAPLVHPEDASLAVEMFQKVLRGDKPPPYELRILSKSGKYLVGEFTSTPYIRDGKVAGKLGIVRDITERKRAEKALRQGEVRLERINRCLLELGPTLTRTSTG